MDTQTLVIALVALCSIGGWYVVLAKYIEVRTILRERERQQKVSTDTGVRGTSEDSAYMSATTTAVMSSREASNWATIIHLSGFIVLTGIPLLNIVLPAILWLLQKERNTFVAKHGSAVLQFQVILTLFQGASLTLGLLFVWALPNAASLLFAWTKTLRVIFSSGMNLPFNMFSILPIAWGCLMMTRAAFAAYCGRGSTYPLRMERFISLLKSMRSQQIPQTAVAQPVPEPPPPPPEPTSTEGVKYSFG